MSSIYYIHTNAFWMNNDWMNKQSESTYQCFHCLQGTRTRSLEAILEKINFPRMFLRKDWNTNKCIYIDPLCQHRIWIVTSILILKNIAGKLSPKETLDKNTRPTSMPSLSTLPELLCDTGWDQSRFTVLSMQRGLILVLLVIKYCTYYFPYEQL